VTGSGGDAASVGSHRSERLSVAEAAGEAGDGEAGSGGRAGAAAAPDKHAGAPASAVTDEEAAAAAAALVRATDAARAGETPEDDDLRALVRLGVSEASLKGTGLSKSKAGRLANAVARMAARMRPRPRSSDPSTVDGTPWAEAFARFCGPEPASFGYEDFFAGHDAAFRTQDFSFSEGAFPVLSRFYPEVAGVLETELSVAFQLTYHMLNGETNFNTTPFRHGIWAYVTRLMGVSTDSFDYTKVNQFVTQRVKTFAKMAVCYPEAVSRAMLMTLSEIALSERIHVVLLAMEARKQAALLIACHAIREHFR